MLQWLYLLLLLVKKNNLKELVSFFYNCYLCVGNFFKCIDVDDYCMIDFEELYEILYCNSIYIIYFVFFQYKFDVFCIQYYCCVEWIYEGNKVIVFFFDISVLKLVIVIVFSQGLEFLVNDIRKEEYFKDFLGVLFVIVEILLVS